MVYKPSRIEDSDPFHPSSFVFEDPATDLSGFQVRFEEGDRAGTIAREAPPRKEVGPRKNTSTRTWPCKVISAAVVSLLLAVVFQFYHSNPSFKYEISSDWMPHLTRTLHNLRSHLPGYMSRQHVREATLRAIGRRDFALAADGARIAPDITTGTFHSSSKPISSHPAEVILRDNMHGGRCWSIPGREGQVGIVATERLHPTHISVDHVPRALADDIQQAPRRMRAWAYVEGSHNEAQVRSVQDSIGHSERDGPKVKGRYSTFLHMADFEYELNTPHHIQTFAIDERFHKLDLDYGVFVIEILDNWGSELTCIYRIRIHGRPSV